MKVLALSLRLTFWIAGLMGVVWLEMSEQKKKGASHGRRDFFLFTAEK